MFDMLKIKCTSCGKVNEREYGEVMPDLRNNHFYKLTCDICHNKTLLTYKIELIPYDSKESTQNIFDRRSIE
jgi:ribosomal protein S27E